jgi:hypothetical protein
MGTYVDKIADPPFDFGDKFNDDNSGAQSTIALVENKYANTMQVADQKLSQLDGYLNQLMNVPKEFSVPEIGKLAMNIAVAAISVPSAPASRMDGIDTDFPAPNSTVPALAPIPTVDASGLTPSAPPGSVDISVDWIDDVYSSTVFTELLAKLLAYSQEGSTGLAPDVEQALIDRAQARQDLVDEKLERETLEFFASRGFELPTGAEDGATAYLAAERARNRTDLNEKVLIEQAELAQKNSQFILSTMRELEAVLRDYATKANDRGADLAKARATVAVSLFSERVKAYLAEEQAKLENIKAQIEYLRGVVESNKGLVEVFKAESEAYRTVIEGKAAKNTAIAEVYKAEMSGYEAETRALVSVGQLSVESKKLEVMVGEANLKADIAEIEAKVKAYETEATLRAGISRDLANIGMQCVASAWGGVSVSAGMSYGFSRGSAESFTHTESRGVDYNLTNSLQEEHKFKEKDAV